MLRRVIPQALRGFVMGAADIVPGVSGGTVALVAGIYEHLIATIRQGAAALGRLARGDWKGTIAALREVDWVFLVPLVGGILVAVATLSSVIGGLLDDYPIEMAGLFLGLILGSAFIAWRLLKAPEPSHLAIAVVVAAALFILLGLRGGVDEDTVDQVADPALWAFFLAGAIAICAMILPGVSGSFLLVLLGMYEPVLDAVSDRDMVAVALTGVGCVIGLALFSTLLNRLLETRHDQVLAALIGLMVGSLRVLWPWPAGIDTTELAAPSDPVVTPIVLAAGAAMAVVVIGRLGLTSDHRATEPDPV